MNTKINTLNTKINIHRSIIKCISDEIIFFFDKIYLVHGNNSYDTIPFFMDHNSEHIFIKHHNKDKYYDEYIKEYTGKRLFKGGVSAVSIKNVKILYLSDKDDGKLMNKLISRENRIGGYYHTAWSNMVYHHQGFNGPNWDNSWYAIVVPLKKQLGRVVKVAPFDTMVYDYLVYDESSFFVYDYHFHNEIFTYEIFDSDNNNVQKYNINNTKQIIENIWYVGKIIFLDIFCYQNKDIRNSINDIFEYRKQQQVLSFPAFNYADDHMTITEYDKMLKYGYDTTLTYMVKYIHELNIKNIDKYINNTEIINDCLKSALNNEILSQDENT